MPSSKADPVVLTDDERSVLLGWSRRQKTAQALALRSRIVLECANGGTNGDIALALGVGRQTVSKWRARFQPGAWRACRTILVGPATHHQRRQSRRPDHQDLEEAPPNGDSHWSTRSMAAQTGLNQTAVSRIWRAFGLKPHVVQSWKLSADPQFVEKVRDVVGLYMAPPRTPWSWQSTRSPRSKPWTAPRRSCRCYRPPRRA